MEGIYKFLTENAIYIVTFIVLIVWAGVFFYLNNLDKRIKGIEKEIKGDKNEK
ncbi:MAG TPA: CcmD family protein [Ignavibacteriaceae bacterium]|nr:CcmD family protein [Ignavibacteriaceae bacterium]